MCTVFAPIFYLEKIMAFDIEVELRSRGFKKDSKGFYKRGTKNFFREVDCQGVDDFARETILITLFDNGEEVRLFNGVVRNKSDLDLLFELLLMDE